MFTGKYTAEDAQVCKKLGGFRAGKLHRCLSASRPRGGLSCVVLCSALQLLLESSVPSSGDVHTVCKPRSASGRSKGLKRYGKRGGSPSLLCLVDHLLQIPYGCCSQRGQQLSQRLQGRAPWLPPPLPWIPSAGSTNWLRALPSKREPGGQATVVVSLLRICQICERRKMNGHKQQRKNMAVLSSKAPGVRG